MPGPFHMAFGVRDLESTCAFYGDVLGCEMGRSAPTWQDFDFFGHQLSAHVTGATPDSGGQVEGLTVPIPHFGAVLDLDAWTNLAARLEAGGVAFHIAPQIRFKGEPGEQGTFFVKDPSGNTLEFKGFKNMAGVFAVGA
jgi:extradiol dioxygenase family protein